MFVPTTSLAVIPPDADRVDIEIAPRTSAAPPRAAPNMESAGVSVRLLASLQDFRACVGLQAEVWGAGYTDGVPASLLQVSMYVGGIVLGAFTPAGEMVGFLFGLTGVDHGEIVHWSHLLGVRDAARDLGVGRLLKETQRTLLAARGVRRMSWTFDPLVAKNAYLNLNRLGARVVAYVPDMYGTTTSPLHFGLATDRLIVSCDTQSPPRTPEITAAEAATLPVLTLAARDGDLSMETGEPRTAFRIEVPTDIRRVIERSPAEAVAWRESVRVHLQWSLAHGYDVTGVHRDVAAGRTFYVLLRKPGET